MPPLARGHCFPSVSATVLTAPPPEVVPLFRGGHRLHQVTCPRFHSFAVTARMEAQV